MYKRKNSAILRLVAILLVVTLALPVSVSAAAEQPVQPRGSYYLDSYNAYVYPAGNGEVEVWFTVTGTDDLDELGALTIQLFESPDNINWYRAISFTHDYTPSMLGYNDFFYASHVDYQGVAGCYYKAYVCIWGGRDGDGDTRYFWTSAKKAT